MVKKEILENIQENLLEIKSGMSQIEQDIVNISYYIDNKQFIPGTLSLNVIVGLERIEKANKRCKEQYESLSGEEFIFEKIENFEMALAEKEEEVQQEVKFEQAKIFHELHSKDKITENLLEREKIKLIELFLDLESQEDVIKK